MTETTQGGALAKTTTPASGTGTGSSSGSSYTGTSYYPRTDVEYGLLWNDGQVTRVTSTGTYGVKDAIKWFMNSIKLRRIGVWTKEFYATGIVTRQVKKTAATSADWENGPWTKYSLTREDMLDLYKAG